MERYGTIYFIKVFIKFNIFFHILIEFYFNFIFEKFICQIINFNHFKKLNVNLISQFHFILLNLEIKEIKIKCKVKIK